MMWLLLLPLWCIALVGLVALCRAAHLEDVARGFADDVLPQAVSRPLLAVPAQRSAVELAR